jgi:DNA-binding HxlR family transcriptional regulator
MSSSVLASRLADLIEARLVVADSAGDYALTEIGEQLKPATGPLLDWSLTWDDALRHGS